MDNFNVPKFKSFKVWKVQISKFGSFKVPKFHFFKFGFSSTSRLTPPLPALPIFRVPLLRHTALSPKMAMFLRILPTPLRSLSSPRHGAQPIGPGRMV